MRSFQLAIGLPLIKRPLELALIKWPLGFAKVAIGAGLDKMAIGAGLYQNPGRLAVDKLLMRRNGGLRLREPDLGVGPSGWSWL